MPKLSIVFPVWNEAENLPLLYQRVKDACRQAGVEEEFIFVDNGSTDRSLALIKELRARDPCVAYLSLSRNFGHQNALFAGMSHATGDAVITMDADLQHPTELIPQMVAGWREGAEVVYTTKRDPHLPFLKRQAVRLFYEIVSRLSGFPMAVGQSDFRLLDRKALDAILRIPEYHKFLRGQVSWIGFRQRGLSYEVEQRYRGASKFSYRNLFSFAIDGMVAFSPYPLRVFTLLGFGIAALSMAYITYVVALVCLKPFRLFSDTLLPPGWATLSVTIFLLGSLQLISLGVMGEYVGRIYDQTKGRPTFIVREAEGLRV